VNASILVVDDDETTLAFLCPLLSDNGYDVRAATTLAAAHGHIARGEADIVVLDVQLPDGYGPSLLERLNRDHLNLPVIVVTGYGEIEMAVEAMKLGAQDFIQKPVDVARLRQAVGRAAERVALQRELEHLRLARHPADNWVIGETPVMKQLVSDLSRVAPSNATILLTGESGTGKEVLASLAHKLSHRAGKPLVAVNCANFGDALLESELFGYEAGAFTGAAKKKDGLIVTADGGTLFLDEISSMKLELQAKLLRVLEERTIRRLGGTSETKVDVRIIAATNRDLSEMVRAGQFRDDLFHRLNVIALRLPPLRDRLADVPALAGFFIQKYNREMGRSIQGVSPAALAMLKAYPWPGNIRQLRNAVERAMLFADGDTLETSHFATDLHP
ncbi:MAG: sigma-54-dependent Fis family transcriptional regulator, partial [Anaerolineales bacterium]|nr:sigma-54-dependent Fis family transcriptional regulator [Anaerolineales bacterium]